MWTRRGEREVLRNDTSTVQRLPLIVSERTLNVMTVRLPTVARSFHASLIVLVGAADAGAASTAVAAAASSKSRTPFTLAS